MFKLIKAWWEWKLAQRNLLKIISQRAVKLAKRKKYAETIERGRMEVAWVDLDGCVYGWNLSADSEIELLKVAALISQVKHDKLVQTVTGGKNGN